MTRNKVGLREMLGRLVYFIVLAIPSIFFYVMSSSALGKIMTASTGTTQQPDDYLFFGVVAFIIGVAMPRIYSWAVQCADHDKNLPMKQYCQIDKYGQVIDQDDKEYGPLPRILAVIGIIFEGAVLIGATLAIITWRRCVCSAEQFYYIGTNFLSVEALLWIGSISLWELLVGTCTSVLVLGTWMGI